MIDVISIFVVAEDRFATLSTRWQLLIASKRTPLLAPAVALQGLPPHRAALDEAQGRPGRADHPGRAEAPPHGGGRRAPQVQGHTAVALRASRVGRSG